MDVPRPVSLLSPEPLREPSKAEKILITLRANVKFAVGFGFLATFIMFVGGLVVISHYPSAGSVFDAVFQPATVVAQWAWGGVPFHDPFFILFVVMMNGILCSIVALAVLFVWDIARLLVGNS